jgi:hypothetical protein
LSYAAHTCGRGRRPRGNHNSARGCRHERYVRPGRESPRLPEWWSVTALWRTPPRAKSVVADQGDRCRRALSRNMNGRAAYAKGSTAGRGVVSDCSKPARRIGRGSPVRTQHQGFSHKARSQAAIRSGLVAQSRAVLAAREVWRTARRLKSAVWRTALPASHELWRTAVLANPVLRTLGLDCLTRSA